jgi:hypothetical protein
MLRNHGWFTLVALTLISIIGCGKTEGPTQPGSSSDKNPQSTTTSDKSKNPDISKLEPPAAACFEFLEAVRTGNDEKASQMLSTVAREKAASLNRSVTPPASDTAKFTLGKVKYINEDGAQVESNWTDADDDGQQRSDTAVWVLRREQQGWRVVGVAAEIFPNEPPLILNFEDPDDMIKQQQWVREEIRRRSEKENLQAKEPDNSENSMRR